MTDDAEIRRLPMLDGKPLNLDADIEAVRIRKAFPAWTDEQVARYAQTVVEYHKALIGYAKHRLRDESRP